MADIIWPVDLPQLVDQNGYGEQRAKSKVESPVDQGRPKARPRFTASTQRFRISLILTDEQVSLLDTFYDETTAKGSLPFDWVHPRTQVAAECQFTGDPPDSVSVGGLMFRASFQMLILP